MRKLLSILLLLVPASLFATTYYASVGGSGSTCSMGSPCTIGTGIGKLASGDTLILNDGTYDAAIANTIPAGSMGAPTILQALNQNLAILKPTSSAAYGIRFDGVDYISTDGVKIDMSASAAPNTEGEDCFPGVCGHITVKNGTVTGATDSAISGQYHDSLFDHMYVHDNGTMGTNQFHGIYLSGDNNIIDHGDIEDQHGGYGVHIYHGSSPFNADNNIVRNTYVARSEVFCILAARNAALIYNNIFDHCGSDGGNIFSNLAINNALYNNTIFTSARYCIGIDNSSGTPSGTIIKGNICYLDAIGAINDGGSGTTCSGNLNASGCGSVEGGSNPLFVASGSGNFHIQAGSPAIGIGANLCSTFCTDYSGAARPAIGAWDAGAFIGPAVPLAATRGFFAF